MADRTVKVALIASVQQYREGMRQAQKATNDFGKEVVSGSAESDRFLKSIGPAALVAGGALAAGLGMAVGKAMEFEQAMSNLGAASGATGDELGALRDAAIEAGAATAFSAGEAALAQTELAKAGIATADILGGALTGALSLAAAGEMDLARAAEVAASTMTQFGLAGSDVESIADALAAGANKAMGSVDDMAAALKQSGLVASQVGLSMEETVGTLGLFAEAGLTGSDAGTSLKTALQRLVPQSEEAARQMEELGLEFFDAQGEFVGMSEVAAELQEALSGLSAEQRLNAMTTLFGSDAIRGAAILYAEGAEGVTGWTEAVSEAGYAQDLAAMKLDNLAGDVEALGGSIETALIKGGSQATGIMRGMAQGATDLVNGFAAMPSALQGVGVGLGAVTSAGLLGVGAFATLAPKIHEAKRALEGMGATGQFVSRNMGRLAGGLGVAGVALAAYSLVVGRNAAEQAEAEEAAKRFTDAILEQGAAIGDLTDREALRGILGGDVGDALRAAEADLDVFTDALREDGDDIRDVFVTFAAAAEVGLEDFVDAVEGSRFAGSELGDELVRLAESGEFTSGKMRTLVDRLYDTAGAYQAGVVGAENEKAVLEATGGAAEDAAVGHEELTAAVAQQTAAIEEAEKALDAYLDLMRGAVDPLFAMLDAVDGNLSAQRDYQDALRGVVEADDAVALAEERLRLLRIAHGRSSQEAKDAEEELADARRDHEQALRDVDDAQQSAVESALDLNVAAAELAAGIAAGNVTLEQAVLMLAEWRDQGLITQEQAAHLATQFGAAADQADRLQGERVLRVRAELDPVLAALFSGANMADRGLIPVALSGTRAAGGPVGPGTWLVGERGPELLSLGASGAGMVTPLNWTGAGSVSSTSTTNAPTIVNNIGSSQLDSMTLARIERAGRRAAEQVQNALGARL